MGKLQKLKETKEEQVTEKKSAEQVDAEISEVSEEGFSVRIQRKVFTAEAVKGEEGRTISFGEESDVEEFSVEFVEQHYLELLPGAWEIIQELMSVEKVHATVPGVETPSLPVKVQDSAPVVPPEVVMRPEIGTDTRPEFSADERRPLPYDLFERDEIPIVYNPGEPGTRAPVQAELYVEALAVRIEWGTGPDRPDIVYEQETGTVQSGTRNGERNAVDVVQEMFDYTGIEGRVYQVDPEEIGLRRIGGELPELPKDIYNVDIARMDMDRTEYFINRVEDDGPAFLAEDSINQYDMKPGDSITFVQSEIFYSEDAEDSYCGTDESLALDDLGIDDIEKVAGYTVPEIPSLGDVSGRYAAPAA